MSSAANPILPGRLRLWIIDAVVKVLPLAALSTFTGGLGSAFSGIWSGYHPWLPILLDLFAIAPLALIRVRPVLATSLVAGFALLQMLTLVGPGLSTVAATIALYCCAKYASARVAKFFLGVGILGAVLMASFPLVAMRFYDQLPDSPAQTAASFASQWRDYLAPGLLILGFCSAVMVLAWLTGTQAGRRRAEMEAVIHHNQLLLRQRDQEAQLAADAERMRIAREMHDVISHSISAMIAQADGGRYIIHQNTARAEAALTNISSIGRESIAELRRMLGVLREESSGKTADHPAPGLSQIPQLLEQVATSGLEVGLSQQTQEHGIPAIGGGIGLACYRIVQEALTNTLKHAGRGSSCEVDIRLVHSATDPEVAAPSLSIRIRDNGLGSLAQDDGAGSGIIGMRERAELYGGCLETRSGAEGFEVLARFPVPVEALIPVAAQPERETTP